MFLYIFYVTYLIPSADIGLLQLSYKYLHAPTSSKILNPKVKKKELKSQVLPHSELTSSQLRRPINNYS
jgi:predicted membrane-bound dolichyl-phosphate-mannose-protein mannosyltransferase